jgi:Protein of unknown function (DUF1003)
VTAIAAPEEPIHPALVEYRQERARSLQNRIADSITTFAGSMWFVYIHVLSFAVWIGFRVEHCPYGLLTMIVSLEAIFLATFVMITQNRQEDARRHLADEVADGPVRGAAERGDDRTVEPDPPPHQGDPRAHDGAYRFAPGAPDDRATSAVDGVRRSRRGTRVPSPRVSH